MRPPLVTAYVSSDAGYGGDGSEENPFRTIIEALGKAGQVDALRVRIFLSQGTYTGFPTLRSALYRWQIRPEKGEG